MLQAHGRHAISAKTTASGSAPPANATPAGIDAAIAAPGAMSVMLWNVTSRRPMAFRRRPVVVSLAVSVVIDVPPRAAADQCPDGLTDAMGHTRASLADLLGPSETTAAGLVAVLVTV